MMFLYKYKLTLIENCSRFYCSLTNPFIDGQQASFYETYLQVMMMVFSPSQDGLSAMILAWVVTSCGDSWGDSLGWVWIQPRGSISCLRKEVQMLQSSRKN